MFQSDRDTASFQFTHDSEPSDALLCGFSQFGLASLSAVDSLVDRLELEEAGHVALDDLLGRGIDSELRACVYVTPVHQQVPDVEAAIRLVETASDVYGLDVDNGPLEEFAGEIAQYYEQLTDRFDSLSEDERSEDRMYM
jgi:uncharacterized protein